ncbi:MAG: hypothetical protein ABS49_11825 [Erythrobacter sp. SCN 62-14]|nr:MAG: hypothetical protein ABS49_11825 [Erythrobacter sp. SCN 62-14]
MTKFFAIIATDKPGATATRMAKLGEHLAHVEAAIDQLAVAGPLRDRDNNFVGSLLVVKADSEAEARAMLEDDPYYRANIWADIQIHAFGAAAGDWVGGKTW